MGHTLQDILFDPKDKILKNTSFKEFLSVDENLSKVVGNAEYVTKSLSQALEDFKDIKEFVEFAPYSSISEYLIPNFTTTLLNKGTVNEAMVIKIAHVDRVGISNRLYQNKKSIDVAGMLLEAVMQLNEKISVGRLMYHPDNITMVVQKNELIVPDKSITESQTEIQEAFFGKKKDKNISHEKLTADEIKKLVSLAKAERNKLDPKTKKCIEIGYDEDDFEDYLNNKKFNEIQIGMYFISNGYNPYNEEQYNTFTEKFNEFIENFEKAVESSKIEARISHGGDWDEGYIEAKSMK